MSIALQAQVDRLEKRVAEMEQEADRRRDMLIKALDGWERNLRRVDALEEAALAATKTPQPGKKANG